MIVVKNDVHYDLTMTSPTRLEKNLMNLIEIRLDKRGFVKSLHNSRTGFMALGLLKIGSQRILRSLFELFSLNFHE